MGVATCLEYSSGVVTGDNSVLSKISFFNSKCGFPHEIVIYSHNRVLLQPFRLYVVLIPTLFMNF